LHQRIQSLDQLVPLNQDQADDHVVSGPFEVMLLLLMEESG
jgi:hypothetical protein